MEEQKSRINWETVVEVTVLLLLAAGLLAVLVGGLLGIWSSGWAPWGKVMATGVIFAAFAALLITNMD